MLARAEALAASMGVEEKSLKYISKLVDLSEADRDDPDTIRDAVSQVLKDVPALVPSETSEDASQGSASPVMPMGRDRSPAPSRANSKGPDIRQLFNQRLRQRAVNGD
jgi:hypothetical protein